MCYTHTRPRQRLLNTGLVLLLMGSLMPVSAFAQQRTGSESRGQTDHAHLERTVTAAYNALSAREKQALQNELWGLYLVIQDRSPAPFLHPGPPGPEKACVACGSFTPYPDDPCDSVRDELKELMEKAIMLGIIRDTVQKLKQAFVDAAFYGGVAQLVADIVSTTVTLATAGTGAGFSRAAAKALAGIAVDQIRGAVIDAITGSLPGPLAAAVNGQLTEAAVDQLLKATNDAAVAANKDKNAKILELQACQKSYNTKLQEVEAANQKYWECREANWGNFCLQ